MRPLIRRLSALTKNAPLRLILVVPFVLQILLIVGLTAWLSIQSGSQAVNEVASQLRNQTSDRIQQYLATVIATPHVINQLNADAVYLKHLNLQDLPRLEYYLWYQIQSFASVNEIKFGTQQGEFAAVERLEDGSFVGKTASRTTGSIYRVHALDQQGQRQELIDQRPNYDPRLRPWYKVATETGKATLGDVYERFSTPKPAIEVINASLPIHDEQKNVIGVASVDLALLGMNQFLHSLEIGRSGKAFILDRSGRLIASSILQNRLNQGKTGQQFKATDSQDPLIQSAARSLLAHFGDLARITTSQQLKFDVNGKLRFLKVTPMQDDKGLDWLIALVVPEADFMDRINANTQTTILLCIAAFGVTTGLGVWTARRITTPILRLSRAAQAIARGDLDQTVKVKGATEINVLAQSFNQMAQQLRDSFAQLEKTNEALEIQVEQRTAALQASEAKFASAFRSSPLPIAISTLVEGRYIDINDAFCRMQGYSREEAIGQTSLGLGIYKHPADRAKLIQMLQETGSFSNQEQAVYTRSGNIIVTRCSAEVIDLNGEACAVWVWEDITDRKRAEEALRISEAKFVAAFSASPFPIGITTLAEGRFLEVNESFCDISGYCLEEIIGRTSTELDFWQSEDRTKIAQNLQAKKAVRNQEIEVHVKSGSIRTVLLSAELIDLNGQACILWVASDITDRKRIEAALQHSEEKYRTIFESSQVGIFQSRSEDGIYLNANQRFAEMFGYRSPAEMIGSKRTADHYVDQNDRAKLLEVLRTNREFHDFEVQVRRCDGSVFWASSTVRRADAGYNEGVLIDISDRKQAEAALQSQLHFLQVLIDAIPTPVSYKDAKGIYLGCNKAYEDLTGLSREQVIGRVATQLYPADAAKIYCEVDQAVLQSQGSQIYEHLFTAGDGSLHDVICSKAAFFNPDGSLGGLVATTMDITDRKAAEVALKAAMEAAEIANQTKSQFLSHMSHELRTPLNAILGFTQLMLRNGALTATQQNYLETIICSGEHLLTLINNVLELSKIEAGKIILQETTCNLDELLNWLHQIFELQATSKGLQLVFDRIDLPHFIQTDESKLRQVLMNLLGNAIKFTQIGSVTLRVTAEWDQLEKRAFPQPLTLSFAVEDTGLGIASTELEALFEPFAQTETGRNSQEGTGLGLPISQQFIRIMGGELSVESQPGKGTFFKFEIPTVADSTDVQNSVAHQQIIGLEAEQPPYRILVVEDKLENRRVLTELLTSVGFEVREAVNGKAAIELWQTWKPNLIWMDLQMPELDGLQATQQIKAASTDSAPVIIAVTGNAFEEDRIAALSAGCDDFVRKPIQTRIILEKMAEHLGVRYRYVEVPESNLSTDRTSTPLTRADFAAMPIEWVEQLHQAASNVSAKQILKLVEQIPPSQTKLAEAIADLVNNFQFETLIELTQRSIDLS